MHLTNQQCEKGQKVAYPKGVSFYSTWTCERSLSLNCSSTCRAPSSLNSFKASIARSSRSLCDTNPEEDKRNKRKTKLYEWGLMRSFIYNLWCWLTKSRCLDFPQRLSWGGKHKATVWKCHWQDMHSGEHDTWWTEAMSMATEHRLRISFPHKEMLHTGQFLQFETCLQFEPLTAACIVSV